MSRNQSVDWGYGATNIGDIKERKQFTTNRYNPIDHLIELLN